MATINLPKEFQLNQDGIVRAARIRDELDLESVEAAVELALEILTKIVQATKYKDGGKLKYVGKKIAFMCFVRKIRKIWKWTF